MTIAEFHVHNGISTIRLKSFKADKYFMSNVIPSKLRPIHCVNIVLAISSGLLPRVIFTLYGKLVCICVYTWGARSRTTQYGFTDELISISMRWRSRKRHVFGIFYSHYTTDVRSRLRCSDENIYKEVFDFSTHNNHSHWPVKTIGQSSEGTQKYRSTWSRSLWYY